MSLFLPLYRTSAAALFPFLKKRLARRHTAGFDERCGVYAREKSEALRATRNIWVHAVSVGEVQAASSFVRAMREDGWDGSITLSTVTETGARSAQNLIGSRMTAHVYAPYDVPAVVRAACDALQPALYVTVETEIWPNLLTELKRRNVPRVLLNARVSDRTWRKKGIVRHLLRQGYALFDLVLARGEEDARRLRALGVQPDRLFVAGDCKVDAILDRRDELRAALPDLRRRLGLADRRACLVAGSTHEGEEATVLEAVRLLADDTARGRPKLVLAPRHPERARAVLEAASAYGRAALFSASAETDAAEAEIVVIDEIGVLFALYGLATAAFVGGSLVPKGGQNILEPACWGVPVAHGLYMDDFAEVTAALDAIRAACCVATAEELAACWRDLSAGDAAAASAATFFDARTGAARRSWQQVRNLPSWGEKR